MMLAIVYLVLVLQLPMDQVEFQGPIVQAVAYTNGSETVNITYTAVYPVLIYVIQMVLRFIFCFFLVFK
jgi:hypothetical protein